MTLLTSSEELGEATRDDTASKFWLTVKTAIKGDTSRARANILVLIAAKSLSKATVLIYIF